MTTSVDRTPGALARSLWQRIETLHAVTYFAPESIAAAKAAGLRGFWMGYFGFRAAPLGPVGPGPVEAAFANFHPTMVRRAIPDAWSFAAPDALLDARAASASAALRRVAPDVEATAERALPALADIVARADSLGRPLFAANRSIRSFVDPVEQLWQHCTTLREHRGDGHVATLAAHGIDGCEAHLLLLAEHGTPIEVAFDHRGWSDDDRLAAIERLRGRGLLTPGEVLSLTEVGRRIRHEIENTTDQLAASPLVEALDVHGAARVVDVLTATATAVCRSGVLPFPNPMGLPVIAD